MCGTKVHAIGAVSFSSAGARSAAGHAGHCTLWHLNNCFGRTMVCSPGLVAASQLLRSAVCDVRRPCSLRLMRRHVLYSTVGPAEHCHVSTDRATCHVSRGGRLCKAAVCSSGCSGLAVRVCGAWRSCFCISSCWWVGLTSADICPAMVASDCCGSGFSAAGCSTGFTVVENASGS